MLTTILFFVIILLIVFLNIKKGMSMGLGALVAGLLIASIVGGQPASRALPAGFPVSMMMNMIIATIFFGFATASGVMDGIAKRLLYKFRRKPALIPIVGFFTSFIVSALGGDVTATPFIMSPMMFSMAQQIGFHPVLAAYCAWIPMVGAFMPWMFMGQYNIGVFVELVGAEHTAAVTAAYNLQLVWLFVINFALFLALYFIFGTYKLNKQITIEKPEPFTQKQSFVVKVLLTVIAVMIIPPIINTFLPSPILAWITRTFSVQSTCLIGAIILGFAKVADLRTILSKNVPWGLILDICGMMFYISFAETMGVIDNLILPLQSLSISPNAILLLISLAYGVLSYFCNGSAIGPILYPIYTTLCTMGLSIGHVMNTSALASSAASFSPFSTGGATALVGCPEEYKEKSMRIQMVLPFVNLAIVMLLAVLGVFNLY